MLRADCCWKKLVIFAPSFNSVKSFGNQRSFLLGTPSPVNSPVKFQPEEKCHLTNVNCYAKAKGER